MGRGLVPEGHLIVAQYEVLGRVFSKAIRPRSRRDDRWLLVLAKLMRTKSRAFYRPYGTDVSSAPFPSTSYWATIKSPCGTDFLAPGGVVRPDRYLLC
jgi:hypothetical protein